MKTLIIFVAVLIVPAMAKAQSQKAKEIKYMTEQIAALKVYTGYIRKGYNTVKGGLRTINDIKSGDLNLHSAYYHSLIAINPEIRRYPKTHEIARIQGNVLTVIKNTKGYLQRSPAFTNGEKQYHYRVFDRLMSDCNETVKEFETVITPGELQMKDDERIRRIDLLHERSLKQWQFAKQFCAEAISLERARTQGQRDIDNSRRLHGIK